MVGKLHEGSSSSARKDGQLAPSCVDYDHLKLGKLSCTWEQRLEL